MAKEIIRACFKSGIVPFLWGEAGIGKSELVKQEADKMEYNFVDLRLGQMEVGDLIGIPSIKDGKTTWLMPEWFPTKPRTIVFLDELNRATHDVIQAIFQFVLNKKLHLHKLPEECYIVCAGNPSDGENYDTRELDLALRTRFLNINLEVDNDVWIRWAKSNNINKDIIDYVSNNPKNILVNNTKENVHISPRIWAFVDKMLKSGLAKEVEAEAIMSLLGDTIGLAFMQTRGKGTILSAKVILKDIKKHKDYIEGLTPDIIATTIDEMVKYLGKDKPDIDKYKGKVTDFFELLPNEIAFSALSQHSEIIGDYIDEESKLFKNFKKTYKKITSEVK